MSSKGVTIETGLPDRLTSQPVPMAGIGQGKGWMSGLSPARGTGWRWRMPDRSGWLPGVGERRIPNLSFCSLSEAKRKNTRTVLDIRSRVNSSLSIFSSF